MKFLAGAIVIFSGSLLWGTAVLATAWIYAAPKGNLGTAQIATCGAVAIIVFGCGMVVAAHRD
jgi:hypothetical protein